MSAGGDAVLNEIEIQLDLAIQALALTQQSLTNLRGFVVRLNTQSDPGDESPANTDGDAAFPSFDDAPVSQPTPSGGRHNGRRQKQGR